MLNRFRRTGAVATLVALTITQGCYAYQPTATGTPRAGERVRVVLTPQGTTELARYLGPNVAAAEGDLASTGPDGTLVVAVDFIQMMNGIRQPWSGEGVVAIPANLRSEVRARTYQRTRSLVAGSALAAILIGVAIIALTAGGAGGAGGGGPPPPPP